jgi:S1-C subfamily serine protease
MLPGAPSPLVTPTGAPPPEPPRSRRRARLLSVFVVVCVIAVVAFWQVTREHQPGLTSADVDRAVQRAIETSQEEQRETPPDAAVAYSTIRPSLVTVTTEGSRARPESGEVGLGAGVIVKDDGTMITALHVVAGGGRIQVEFADGTSSSAHIESKQPSTDIAVLVADELPSVVVPAVLGGVPPVGDDVFAVGNPLGLRSSLTAGVVSAHDRSIRAEDGTSLNGLVQFDAAVNPGNSGGPLLNRGGQVVGIVTALANPSKQAYFVGIGFAVPIATATGGGGGGPQQ